MIKSAAFLALEFSVAACAPVSKEHVPTTQIIGIGTIKDVEMTVQNDGESSVTRGAVGLLAGGPIVMFGASNTESGLQTTTKWRYKIDLGGQTKSYQSHATVKTGDCVEVALIDGSPLSVLTRVEPNRC